MPCVIACNTAKPKHAVCHEQARRKYAVRRRRSGRQQNSGRSRAARPAVSNGGKRMAESCGHGRVSRPENFTTRPASQRLKRLVRVARTAAVAGITDTRKLMNRSGSVPPGNVSGVSTGVSVCTLSILASASWRPARKLSPSVPKFGMATTTTSAARIAAHATMRPVGYHSSESARGRCRSQGERAWRDSQATRREYRRQRGTQTGTRRQTRSQAPMHRLALR